MAQRNIREEDVWFVYRYGRRFYNGDQICFFLGKRDIPRQYRHSRLARRCEGLVLVVDAFDESTIVTAYHANKRALKRLRCKPRYWTR